jgi:ATP/maltotriose-dependent transcriptional regulator MalT
MDGSPPERDVLLATKLQVPRSRPGLVPRRRLADRLEEGLNRGLVLVAAPAGYGKSVLLSEWVRGMTETAAWLSLDGGDNDPVRFWRHVLAALDMVRPGIAERVGPLAGPPAPPTYDALVSALINDVVAEPGQPDVLLVLDDYHLISSDSVQASVRFLLDHRPPQLRVVVASRSDPSLGLARYRGRGELGEVRAADLRFNLDEAAELLRQVLADLDLSVAAALAERTEGWAVGLQLAALSLRTQPDVARFVAAFTGSHRYVLDYLTEEVLGRQRQDLRLGEVAYQRDDLDRALEYVTRGITLCRQFVHTPPLAAGLVALAWIRQAAGDRRGARDAMTEAESFSAGPAGLLNPVPAQRARLLLAQDDVAGAARWVGNCGLGPGDEPDYPNEPGHLVLARLLLAQGDAVAADALLDRLEGTAAGQQRVGSLIEIRAIRAMALAALGDEPGAVAALTSALDLGCPQGYVRVFADEGPAMAAVLGRLIAAQRSDQRAARIPLACLARLQRAFGDGHPAGGPASGPGGGRAAADARGPRLIDQLTSRELEVLAMLAAGRSNQGIASQLVISLDTVKKHVSHLMGKLGAANRTEAVARGRELGLISEDRSRG